LGFTRSPASCGYLVVVHALSAPTRAGGKED
jgi:hypothetical protein